MNFLNLKSVVSLFIVCFLLCSCNSTSDKIAKYINQNCDFKSTVVLFNIVDSAYYTSAVDTIDLKSALSVDYDTLYLISVGFESDISEIIGFQYEGGDFTIESENKNLLLLVKQNKIVYKGTIRNLLDEVMFVYPHLWTTTPPPSSCLLKHSSSMYKVEREKEGLRWRYFLSNIE